jgi:hypothetical protein
MLALHRTRRWRLAAALCATLLVSACWDDDESKTTGGGGGGTPTPTASAAPTVSGQPADQTVTAGGNASFTVTATGSGTLTYTWQASSDGGSTFADVAGTAATLTVPSTTLADSTKQFRARVCNTETGLTSTCVTSSAAVLTVNAAVTAAVWVPPLSLAGSTVVDTNDYPVAGIDDAGNTLAAWPTGTGAIVASRGTYGGAWADPVGIGGGSNGNLQMSVSPGGQAMAVWLNFPSNAARVVVNRFDGTSWVGGTILDPGTAPNYAEAPQVAVDGQGRAVAAWQRSESGGYSVRLRLFNGSTWAASDTVVSTSGQTGYPRVAVSPAGTGYVTFVQGKDLVAIPVDLVAGTVGTPAVVVTGRAAATFPISDHALAVDAGGGALVAWVEDVPSGYDLRAARAQAGVWSAPVDVQTNVDFNRDLAVATGAAGEGVVAWVTADTSGNDTVFARRVTAAGGWAAVDRASDPGAGSVEYVQAAMNAAGRIVVAWTQDNATTGRQEQWARTFDGTWDAARAVGADASTSVQTPRLPAGGTGLALSSSGKGVLVWWQGTSPNQTLGAYLQP